MSSLGSLLQELELFQTAVSEIYVINYFTVGVFAALIYDTFLSLPKEIEFIWSMPVTIPKCLYLISRYYGLLCLGIITFMSVVPDRSLSSCRTFIVWYTSATLQVAETVIDLILFLRIYALYGRNKTVTYIVIPIFIVDTASTFYAGIEAGKEFNNALVALPFKLSVPNCELYVRNFPAFKITLAAWIPSLCVALLFFSLSAFKVYEKVIAIGGYGSSSIFSRDSGIPSLMRVIARDGVIFFFALTLVIILNATLVFRLDNPYSSLGPPIYLLVQSLCGCHLLLNLFEVGKRQLLLTQVTGADVVFQPPSNVFMVQSEFSGPMAETLPLDILNETE